MQIVIDIPEEIYSRILERNRIHTFDNETLCDVIKNGTPLPKHGRIADMDEAIKCIEEVEGEDAIWAISLIEWACAKRTIIEADTESEET